jgi:hypothetical protein
MAEKQIPRVAVVHTSAVLGVEMKAEFLTVSTDTIYDLFKSGKLPGRKVGQKRLRHDQQCSVGLKVPQERRLSPAPLDAVTGRLSTNH